MSGYLGKYHIGINNKGYLISQRGGRRWYQKKRAPAFLNRFGSGDASYRDSTFWQFFVQTNWRNGSKQLKFDDPGKFWKSENVDTTQLEELTLSKAFESVGQLAAGVKVNALESWRSSMSWWNTNYSYRQQITVTAPSGKQVPAGYPIKVTIDTAALQSASKVRSDRNDWRIVYFNGTNWVDLTRDYISGSITFFALQSAISAGASDSNYYVYYGYSSESTSKQPTTEADWNAVYGMFGTTPDVNSVLVAHFREGSGSTINDDSSSSNHGTVTNGSWGNDGLLGRYQIMGSSSNINWGAGANLNLGSFTLEAFIYHNSIAPNEGQIFYKRTSASTDVSFAFGLDDNRKLYVGVGDAGGGGLRGTNAIAANTWYHVAATFDGTTANLYINGVLDKTGSIPVPIDSSGQPLYTSYNGAHNGSWQGRIQHARVSNIARTSFPYALGQDEQPTVSYGSETTTQPPSTSFDLYAGGSDGRVYKWDGTTTWTEQFDTRRIVWHESGNDTDMIIGDQAGVERAQAQSFQLSHTQTIKGLEVFLKKNAGSPGNITVRIETNSSGVPSGTLAHSNATATISSFSTTSYGWISVEFANEFSLSASTTYWIVLKIAAGPNDNNYAWAADGSSPAYSGGNMASSSDGGSTWTGDTTKDAYFRVKGQSTQVNCMLLSSVGGTQKLYVGTGNPTGQVNGDARLYSYDGSVWALTHVFTSATESMINSLAEYIITNKAYIGVGPQARIYETSNFSTFTLSKDINIPQNPGYVYAMKEYNSVLHAGGGSPEFLPTKYYNGFLNVYDSTQWRVLYPFDFTVIKSLEFYDAFLFIGTYRGDLYVYDTSSLNPLFNFKDLYNYKVQIMGMKYFDDKLYIGLYPQDDSNETNVGVWVFDRRGLSLAHTVSGVSGYRCFAVANGSLFVGTGDNGYVYKLSDVTYNTQGWYQSSYFDANLPSVDKLYNNVTIKHDPLESGQSIVVYYRFKESDSWVTLGTSNTIGSTEKTLSFPSATYSKKISLKVELNTTNTATTPKLTETVMQYALYPVRKWQWTFRVLVEKNLKLLDKSTEPRSVGTIRSDLEVLLNTQSLFSFVDIDSTVYTVLVYDIDETSWVVNQSDVNENEVVMTIIEA